MCLSFAHASNKLAVIYTTFVFPHSYTPPKSMTAVEHGQVLNVGESMTGLRERAWPGSTIGRKMSFEVSVEKLFKCESISDQHD